MKGRSREGGSHKSVGGRRMWCGRWEAVTPCSPISKFSLARALFKEFLIIVYLNSER